jgi:hypothetical protein
VRLASLVGELAGDDNPLLHPRHAEQLDALGGNGATVRALSSPGLHRPGERLHLDVDGRQVVLAATRHRLGSDAADRVIDPAPIVFAWGAALVVADWIAYKPPVPLLVAVAAVECAVGAAHAKLRLSPAQTLRNALLGASAVTCTGALLSRQTDPTGTPGLVFAGSSAFPYALLLGHWWKTIDSRQRVVNGLGGAGLCGLLAARASAIAPSTEPGRWWLRTFFLDNTIWWGMLFVTAFGLDHDMEVDLAIAMDEADRVAARRFDEVYTAAWQASRDRVAARAALLERSLNTYGAQFGPDIVAAIRDDLAEVAAWVAEPS